MVIQSTPPRSLFNPHPPPSHPRFPLFGWGRWNRLPVTACLFVQTDFASLPQRSCWRGGGRSTLLCVYVSVCVHLFRSGRYHCLRMNGAVRRRTTLKEWKVQDAERLCTHSPWSLLPLQSAVSPLFRRLPLCILWELWRAPALRRKAFTFQRIAPLRGISFCQIR